MSDIYNFTTALAPGDPTPFNFITFGDHGVSDDTDFSWENSPGAGRVSSQILDEYRNSEDKPRLIFHHGDISYARGQVC